MDLWEMACDPDFQKQLRESDPRTFERLAQTFRYLDCSAKPSRPSDGAANGSARNRERTFGPEVGRHADFGIASDDGAPIAAELDPKSEAAKISIIEAGCSPN